MDPIQRLFDLSGKNALVTGGGSGIGKSFTRVLSAAGANVMIAARDVIRLKQTAEEIAAVTGHPVYYSQVDLSERRSAVALIKHAQATMGSVDILVCNAAVEIMEFVEDIADESVDQMVAVNFSSNIAMTTAVARQMKQKKWGRIIYISSTTTFAASKHSGHGIYTATKSALQGFARVAAVDLGMHGITVNTIVPGTTKTEMVDKVIKETCKNQQEADAFIRSQSSMTALNRMAAPDEMAGALLLLVSDAGCYITGATYVVDGGQTIVLDPVVRPA
jgi:NAD(P)-dependent dehydrogenase (short-subunit alcohol dehydrogenase family)